MSDESYSRRALTAILAVLIVSTTVGGVAGVAAAASGTNEHRDTKPSHVTLTYNESELETYAPALVTRHLEQQPAEMYGWKASSPNHDTDVYVYFAFYPVQRGYSEYDSHVSDREPVYVFVDNATGEVERVTYSGYHYMKGALPADQARIQDGTHPTVKVAQKHHHYIPTSKTGDPPNHVENLGATPGAGEFDAWLANGWSEDLDPGSVTNPWSMRDRADWWRESATFGVSVSATLATVDILLGSDGAGGADFGVIDHSLF